MAAPLLRNPPFRAEHMGSLLRPQSLLDVRKAIAEGKGTPESLGLAPVEAEAVAKIVELERDLGFRAVTDGEYTRTRFWGVMWNEFEGTKAWEGADADLFRLYHPDVASFIGLEAERHKATMPGESVIAEGKIRHKGWSTNAHELELVQANVPNEHWGDIKMTIITPTWYHMRYKEGAAYSKAAYVNDAEYFADVAKAYQTELDVLYKAGLRNVQFDDPNMAYFCSEKFRSGYAADSNNTGTVEDLLDSYIKLYNECIAKCPPDMHTGIHLCRGNFIGGKHFAEGAYDSIAAKLFKDLNVNTYYLEYDTDRAGGFEPLKHLPKNKNVIIGVISTKLRELEDKEAMKQRIYQAADFIAQGSGETKEEALKRVGVSPQCGFSTHESGYPLNWDEMSAKLKLVRTIADEIWPGEP
jgi:methionine synthase II (cobalamin-independent)